MGFPQTEQISCPRCKHSFTLHHPQDSEFAMCSACNSFLQFDSNDQPVVQLTSSEVKTTPILTSGTTGHFKGYDFKVLSYLEKKETQTQYAWREYVLYNYEKGYATLSEYDGHWTFVGGENFYPDLKELTAEGRSIRYQDLRFDVFNKYATKTTAVLGEFDSNVIYESVKTAEFVNAPNIIYKETTKHQQTPQYYLGIYVDPKEIASAFQIDQAYFPRRIGIGANQPSIYAKHWISICKISFLSVLAVAAIGYFVSSYKPTSDILSNYYVITSDSTRVNEFKPFKTEPFTLKGNSSALQFNMTAPVENDWLEATVVLVNDDDNQSWEVTKSIEYYHGYEDGERWTEGSQQAEVLLSSIPAGNYHLNIYPAAGSSTDQTLSLRVKANPVIWRNIWVTILLLCLFPLYVGLRMRDFEKRRWMNSDYSPFDSN